MPHDVFISYSSKNKTVADALCHYLEAHQIRCWIAPRDIPPGSSYGEEIDVAITKCKAFVIIFSKDSAESKYCPREIDIAINENKIVIPFRIDKHPLQKQMRFYLSDRHWIDACSDPEALFGDLCSAILGVLNNPGSQTGVQKNGQTFPASGSGKRKKRTGLVVAAILVPVLILALALSGLIFLKDRGKAEQGGSEPNVSTNKPNETAVSPASTKKDLIGNNLQPETSTAVPVQTGGNNQTATEPNANVNEPKETAVSSASTKKDLIGNNLQPETSTAVPVQTGGNNPTATEPSANANTNEQKETVVSPASTIKETIASDLQPGTSTSVPVQTGGNNQTATEPNANVKPTTETPVSPASTGKETAEIILQPNAFMSVYTRGSNQTEFEKDSVPVCTIKDSAKTFSISSVKAIPGKGSVLVGTYKSIDYFKANYFVVWEGFFQVDSSEDYLFSVSQKTQNVSNQFQFFVTFEDEEEPSLSLWYAGSRKKQETNSCYRSLKQGFHKVMIVWVGCTGSGSSKVPSFTFEYSKKSDPTTIYPITPAKLFHELPGDRGNAESELNKNEQEETAGSPASAGMETAVGELQAGAFMSVYARGSNQTEFEKDSVPICTTKDSAKTFSISSVKTIPNKGNVFVGTYKSTDFFKTNYFVVWEGFFQVDSTEEYLFSVSQKTQNVSNQFQFYVTFGDDEEPSLSLWYLGSRKKQETNSCSRSLKKGLHKVTIVWVGYTGSGSSKVPAFALEYSKRSDPTTVYPITPAKLFHE